jgi:ribosome-binding protein aMBF1 (putative translation factor)
MPTSWAEVKASRAGSAERHDGYRYAAVLHETGDKVRSLRREAGLSQRELSQRAQISPSTVSRLESGEALPAVAALLRISQALGAEFVLRLEAGASLA